MIKKLVKYSFILLFSLSFSLTGCEDDSKDNDKYSFKVIASNGNATGYYSIDGGSFKYFDTEYSESSSFYSYEKDISSLDSILIYAIGEDTNTSSISIYLYDESELLDSVSASQTESDVKVSLTLDYTEPDEDADSDDDSTK